MGYPLALAVRYLSSKKRAFVSVGTTFAILGVTLGVAALAIVMSVTGGFQEQFREKVLGVNAHVLVLKYSLDFREYRDVMKKVRGVKGVLGVAPFLINAMMVTHGDHTCDRRPPEGGRPGAHGPGARPAEAHRLRQPRRPAPPGGDSSRATED